MNRFLNKVLTVAMFELGLLSYLKNADTLCAVLFALSLWGLLSYYKPKDEEDEED